jgi:hypothetical protein
LVRCGRTGPGRRPAPVIVNDTTHIELLVVLLAGMALMSGALLIRARRKGWW